MANDLPTQIATLMALLQKAGQQGMQTGPNPQVQALAQNPAMANMGGPPPTQQNNLIQSLQGLNQAQPAAPQTLGMGQPMPPLPLPNADPQGQQNNAPVDPFAAALGQ